MGGGKGLLNVVGVFRNLHDGRSEAVLAEMMFLHPIGCSKTEGVSGYFKVFQFDQRGEVAGVARTRRVTLLPYSTGIEQCFLQWLERMGAASYLLRSRS